MNLFLAPRRAADGGKATRPESPWKSLPGCHTHDGRDLRCTRNTDVRPGEQEERVQRAGRADAAKEPKATRWPAAM